VPCTVIFWTELSIQVTRIMLRCFLVAVVTKKKSRNSRGTGWPLRNIHF
jgi:hypothetical protein